MHHHRRTVVRGISLAALAMALAPQSVAAQNAEPARATAADENSGEIIVTARRSEESLQDVPISITVFNQQQIAERNIVTAADLGTYTPSLSINSRFGPDKASFVIRGFVQEQYTMPSVGVYFADVVAPRAGSQQTAGNGAGPGSFFDLQNIQVLKGPQGTLFGRNTTGGAILLVPQKPTDALEGYVEGSAGNYGMRRVQAALNLPLAETFRMRLAVDRNKTDGYLKGHSGIGPDRYADTNYVAARMSIVGDLTPDLENYLIASYSRSDSNGSPSRLFACDATRTTQAAVNACAQVARQNARGDDMWDVEAAHPFARNLVKQWQVINTTTWQASDSLTIKNIVSYSNYEEAATFSLNGDNFTVRDLPGVASPAYIGLPYYFVGLNPGPDHGRTSQHTFTEELQLQGNAADGGLKWQAGAYLEISSPPFFNQVYSAVNLSCTDARALQCVSPFGAAGSISNQQAKFHYNNKGFYAQATYSLTPQLAVTGGIRYTIDRLRVTDASTRIRFPVGGGTTQTCANTVVFGQKVAASGQDCFNSFRQNSSRPTWLVDLEYKPIDDVMLYGKWSRGYRQGGITPNNIGLETWGPEKVDTYELGAKTRFGAGDLRGYFNVTGFYNDFSDQQIVAFLLANPTSGFAGGAAIVNAGKSVLKGVEADGSVTLFDQLKFDLGYAYLSTKVKSIVQPTIPADAPFNTVVPSASAGDRLSYSPKHRLTLTGTWTLPLDESIGKVSVGATWVYTASQIATKASPFGVLPSSNLLNLNASWNEVMGAPIDLSFFMTNVTNEFAPLSVANGWSSNAYEAYVVNPPRMWGLRAKYRFGH